MENQQILEHLYKKRDELTFQLKAVNQAIESTQIAFGITHKSTSESFTPALPVTSDAYSKEFPMDKKVCLILKEIGPATVSQIASNMAIKEPETAEDVIARAVSMAVSRLHTVGNAKYINTNGGKLKAKADTEDSRRKIYFL